MIAWPDKTPSEVPVVIIDTETTGLSPALGHRVVELGALRLEAGQPVAEFATLINPSRPMDPGASAVNGIFDADLVAAPPFAEILPDLEAFLSDALLVAHNARFDAGFLAQEFALARGREASPHSLRNPWLCTLQLSRHFFYFGRNSLANVASRLGVPPERRHRALDDARTTAAVFTRMLPLLARHRLSTVEELLAAQGGPIYAEAPAPPSLPAAIHQAAQSGRMVRIRYRTQEVETERLITPLYATERAGTGYVVAFCHLRRERRTFRLDRIVAVEGIPDDRGV